jgi:hypothetical protein
MVAAGESDARLEARLQQQQAAFSALSLDHAVAQMPRLQARPPRSRCARPGTVCFHFAGARLARRICVLQPWLGPRAGRTWRGASLCALPRQAPMVSVGEVEPAAVVATLRSALDAIGRLSGERAGIEEALKVEKNKDNILPRIMAAGGQHDRLFAEELKQYEPLKARSGPLPVHGSPSPRAQGTWLMAPHNAGMRCEGAHGLQRLVHTLEADLQPVRLLRAGPGGGEPGEAARGAGRDRQEPGRVQARVRLCGVAVRVRGARPRPAPPGQRFSP